MRIIMEKFDDKESARCFINWFVTSSDRTYATIFGYKTKECMEPKYIGLLMIKEDGLTFEELID